MKIGVLGSSGQIGTHLCQHLENLGHTVFRQDIVGCDYGDLRQGYWHEDQVDFIFFLAFDVGGSKYLSEYQHSYEFINNNIRIMDNVFSRLYEQYVPFIFASSQMSNMIDSPYGMLKRIGEFYTHSLSGVNVKFWNIYGQETDPAKFHVVTDFLLQAQQDKKIKMLTDGKETRQFLYVQDSSLALTALMNDYNDLDHKVSYDITSFTWTSIKDIANIVADIYPGTKIVPGKKKDYTQTIKNEPNDNILKYWKPTISLREGIKTIGDSL